jgi:hypothetical protein
MHIINYKGLDVVCSGYIYRIKPFSDKSYISFVDACNQITFWERTGVLPDIIHQIATNERNKENH